MSATDENGVVDAEIVEEQPPRADAGPVSTSLAPRQRRSEVIRPLDADQLIESFGAYQELLPRLLDDSDYQAAGRGKRFVKKSGWRKIATAFDLDVQIIRSDVERDADGQPCRAEVWARAIAPSGRSMDGDGYCSIDEERFSGSRGNKSKLENDLRATATTRAMNRAISGLVGMGEVSAEETDAGGQQQGAATVVEASVELKNAVRGTLGVLLGGEERAVAAAIDRLAKQFEGKLPASAAQAIVLLGYVLRDHRNAAAPTTESVSDDQAPLGSMFDRDETGAEQ